MIEISPTPTPTPTPTPIAPAAVRYIKLGQGGRWEAASLEGDRIDCGFASDDHTLARVGDWVGLQAAYIAQGVSPSTATGYARELREFYTLGADTLWITFARGFLWWTFAEPEVIDRGVETMAEGACYRRTIGPWRNTDILGKPLPMHALSTRLTQLAAYRRTICSVGEREYLLARLNAQPRPVVARAQHAREELVERIAMLIAQLHWAEFELLIDLIFTRSGWRRVTALGGTMKDIDLLVEQPITGERIAVQVKSKADQTTLNDCITAFGASGLADRFYFICHSASCSFAIPSGSSGAVVIWTMPDIATAAVDAGLTGWLIEKAA